MHELKKKAYQANINLVKHGLVILTWGNASLIDRERGLVAIKPSGVEYEKLTPEDMVILNLDGKIVEGDLNPSSDTQTHLEIYKAFPGVGGIVHTHSEHATSFAQAEKEIDCLGTTHADTFYGSVPVTRQLREDEMEDYEKNTGKIIAERFKDLDPSAVPACLVASHGPFTWGKDAENAVENAIILEQVAKMNILTLALEPSAKTVPKHILEKHYLRKHGKDAYYGQR